MSNTEDTEKLDVSKERENERKRMKSLKSKLCRDVTSFLQKHYSFDYQSRTIPFNHICLTFDKKGSLFTKFFPVSEFKHNKSLFLLECHICDKKGDCKSDCAINKKPTKHSQELANNHTKKYKEHQLTKSIF
eukprot:GHVP01054918.1.p1 GENE.GHVP01054918.1~~GHVP01054918.1.p1  ORF type:complete len:132 (+),score=23.16 GHVP01054918.1:145-540(+)